MIYKSKYFGLRYEISFLFDMILKYLFEVNLFFYKDIFIDRYLRYDYRY